MIVPSLQVAHSCQSQGAADCEVYPFDLLNTAEVDSLAQKVLRDRHIDVLVNNAGIMVAGSVHQGTGTSCSSHATRFCVAKPKDCMPYAT